MNKQAIIKALKEFARMAVLAIPALLIQLISNNPNDTIQYGGAVLFVLRAVDKYIHESPTINAKGILPF